MSVRDELNTLLTEALARGERPFKCWACQQWFVETEKRKGRARLICEAPACRKARIRYVSFGLMPDEPTPPTVEQCGRTMMARAVLRAIEADWLTDIEIAEDLGCSPCFVNGIRTRAGRNRFKKGRAA